ncbi:ABC transporter substrate-binding protein [Cohnella lupini]|uniref:Carbohydrate ABC transporter substrate-binding protein (CUT1 family) n=1 Tax=Cohnella lupini TaxID=1294267 RepID=A0A3D9ISP2_9BACL|nr:extracellular solute-binding protein [Cohnella lupini]RED64718.1 carbohydrate ABC transporter substrate-binding protein (CUT1 family) [Cohnella lupini]
MKRLFSSAVILLLMSAVLAACGGNNNKEVSGSSESPSSSSSSSPSSSNASTGEKVKLTMGSWRTDDKAVYEKIIKEFNKQYPNIEIEFAPTKSTEYNAVLSTALQTASGPDIIHLRPYAAGIALGEAGYIEPINDLKGLDVFSKDVLAASTGKDGKTYGVPMALNIVAIMYNKDLFAKYNLAEPKTWDELIQISKTLKENDVTPFAMGTKDSWILSLTQGAIGPSIYGGTEFAQGLVSGQKKFTDPAYVKSLQTMKDLQEFFPDKYTGIGSEDMRTLFVTGQAAMYVMGDFDLSVVKSMNPEMNVDVFPVPSQSAGGSPTVTTYVDGSYAVNTYSKHKEEAKKFLEFTTTKEFGNLFANEMKRVSPIPGVVASDPLVAKYAGFADSISTPYVMVTNFNGGNPTTKVTLENEMQAMYFGKKTPDEVAQAVQSITDTWFKP